jgi:anti-sigma factor RsiW
MTKRDQQCQHAEDVAPYVIGALDRDSADAFDRHLAACPSCRAEVEDFSAFARLLPLAAECQQPPPELKQSLMSVVRAEAELLRAAGPEADRAPARPPRRRWWGRLAAWPRTAVAGGLATAVAVAIAVAVLAGGDGADTRTIQARVTAPSAKAQVVLDDGSGTLTATGMPVPTRGHVYAIWTQRAGESPRLAATVSAGGDMEAKLDLDSVDTVMVTVEPTRVGRMPTSAPVLTADLA